MPAIISPLLTHLDWRTTFAILAGLVFLLVLLPALAVLKSQPPVPREDTTPQRSTLQMMRSRPVIQLGIAYLAPTLMFIGVLHNLGVYAMDIGVSQTQVALIISLCSVVMAIGKLCSGALSDRVNLGVLYTGVILMMGLAMFITGLATSFLTLLGGVCLLALMGGSAAPLAAAIVASRWPMAEFGRVLGVVQAFAALSGLSPLVAALIREATGSYAQAFLWLTAILVPAIICFLTLPKVIETPRPVATAPASA